MSKPENGAGMRSLLTSDYEKALDAIRQYRIENAAGRGGQKVIRAASFSIGAVWLGNFAGVLFLDQPHECDCNQAGIRTGTRLARVNGGDYSRMWLHDDLANLGSKHPWIGSARTGLGRIGEGVWALRAGYLTGAGGQSGRRLDGSEEHRSLLSIRNGHGLFRLMEMHHFALENRPGMRAPANYLQRSFAA